MKKIPFLVLFAVLFITLSARCTIELPWGEDPIPITAQSLAVLLTACFLKRKWAAVAVALYVVAGAAGLPVFAGGRSGTEVLSGGSGGFLYGFVVAAYAVGYLAERGWDRRFGSCLAAMAIGTALIIIAGLAQLTFIYGWEKALQFGFFPVLPGAMVKIVLGAIILSLYYYFMSIWNVTA